MSNIFFIRSVYSHQLHVALVDELLLELGELLAGGGVRVHVLGGDVAHPAQPRPVGDVDVLRRQSYTSHEHKVVFIRSLTCKLGSFSIKSMNFDLCATVEFNISHLSSRH